MLALLSLISFVVPPAAVVTFPLKLLVVAMLFAWDLCDYPLSVRGMPVGARVTLVARHVPAMLGFGLGLALLSLLPCAAFLALPIGVAGLPGSLAASSFHAAWIPLSVIARRRRTSRCKAR